MIKKLKVDHDFTPCSVTTGDEIFPNGFFEFNITKIIEHIKNNRSYTIGIESGKNPRYLTVGKTTLERAHKLLSKLYAIRESTVSRGFILSKSFFALLCSGHRSGWGFFNSGNRV